MFSFLQKNSKKITTLLPVLMVSVLAVCMIIPESYADGINSTDFVTTWKTDNQGLSNSTSVTIPTTGSGYNYDVDWNNDGTFDELGLTGNVTHNFGIAGTYTIRIRGSFPRIYTHYLDFYFTYPGDARKLISVDQWGSISWSSMDRALSNASNLITIPTTSPDLSNVTNMTKMFSAAALFNQNLSSWNVGNVTDMNNMFARATAFNQDISSWNVGNVTNMSGMFGGATAYNQDLSTWNVGSVQNVSAMFSGATAFNKPLNSWNVGNVTTMNSMFSGATAFNKPLNSWNVGSVQNMFEMFSGASLFNQDISSWNVGNVTNMSGMFSGASSFNQNISSWNVGNVQYMTSMFQDATSFNQNLSSWNVGNVVDMSNMFANVTLSTTNYDALLAGWSSRSVQPDVIFDAGNSTYCNSSARSILTSAPNNWTITDGGLSGGDCTPPDAPVVQRPSQHEIIQTATSNAEGTCETDATVTISGAALQTNPTTTTCVAGSFSTSIAFTPGSLYTSFVLSFTQTDPAGNTSTSVDRDIQYAPQGIIGGGGLGLVTIDKPTTTSLPTSNENSEATNVTENVPSVETPPIPVTNPAPEATVVPVNEPENISLFVFSRAITQKNSHSQDVSQLQGFLNMYEGESLTISGQYDIHTQDAINRFQLKYAREILAPWGLTHPTGNVGVFTRDKINTIIKAQDNVVTPVFIAINITPKRQNTIQDVTKLQEFLNNSEGEQLDVNGIYNGDTIQAINRFQLKYAREILAPWGLTHPTGNVGVFTRDKIQKLMEVGSSR